MHKNLNKLIDEIGVVYEKIGNTSFSDDNRIALIELTRCIDHAYVYTTYIQNKKNEEGIKVRIERNGAQELVKSIKSVKQESVESNEVKLLILGRNFSHFSDLKQEKRASWASWYRLQRILHEKPEFKTNLSRLMNYLEKKFISKEAIITT